MSKRKAPQHHSMELEVRPKAEMSIEYFSPFHQKTIWKAIEVLQQEGIKTPQFQIYKLADLNNVFMMRINKNLRMIFSLEGKSLAIWDVFTRETLLRLKRLFEGGKTNEIV